MTRPLVIIGAGGHARSCIDVIEAHGGFKIVGLIGNSEEVGRNVLEHRVIGSDDDLPGLAKFGVSAIVAVGQIRTSKVRHALFAKLRKLGFELPAIISPRAYVSRHSEVGAGSIIMHHVTVNAGVTIGCNCIINTAAIIEHDCNVDDHCHISTGAIVNGGVCIGKGCFVGSGSIIHQERVIGEGSVVGMGVPVRQNILPGEVLRGANE